MLQGLERLRLQQQCRKAYCSCDNDVARLGGVDQARNSFVAGKIRQACNSFVKGEVKSFYPETSLFAVLKKGGGLHEFDSWLVVFQLVGVGQLFGVVLFIHRVVGRLVARVCVAGLLVLWFCCGQDTMTGQQ